jgi:arylsulfatase A-like enzyme
MREAVKVANARLLEKYRDSAIIVLDSLDEQLYLNRPLLREKRISLDEASAVVAEAVRALPWVQNAWGAWALKAEAVTDPFARRLALGCHPDRSGDVFILPKPGYIEGNRPTGTTHSSTYPYDTHVPMLFYGWGIKPGESVEEVSITDIAPTLAALLKIQMPSATTGKAHFIKRKR